MCYTSTYALTSGRWSLQETGKAVAAPICQLTYLTMQVQSVLHETYPTFTC